MLNANIDLKRIFKIAIFAILFLNSFYLFAKEKKWEQQITGSAIQVGATISVIDPELVMTNYVSTSTKSFIELKIDDYAAPFYWYNCKIKVKITPTLNDGTSGTPYLIDLAVVNNHYGNFGNFVDLQKHLIVNGLRGAAIEVINVNVSNLDTTTTEYIVPANVKLTVSFETERFYDMSSSSIPILMPIATINTSNNNLDFSWQDIPESEEYELEWTWVDNYKSTVLTEALPPSQILFSRRDFELNNTRVQTLNPYYSIPLIYDKGYIIFRVRPIGRYLTATSKKYEGIWSINNPNLNNVQDWNNSAVLIPSHNNINWQFQSSYAEQGKKKEVVSYFDGSLRNRQTVTKINTNDKVIVGEVIYDEEGRPAVEVLPVPTQGNKIEYYPDFNKNTNQKVYSYQDLYGIGGSCTIAAEGMTIESGASKYYSQNSAVLDSYQDFVPEANEFPFSQTEYSLDNTGRVKRKGGVGFEHQLGRQHEMKYFYTIPTQDELNRLFGYSVGFVSHYKKNIVVDPNHQFSVSYIDPQGRTVATALSGNSPEAMHALDDEKDGSLHQTVTTDLLNKLKENDANTDLDNNIKFLSANYWGNYFDGLRYDSQKVFDGNYEFSYKLRKPDAFTIDCGNFQYAYPYKYILNLDVKDECGVKKNPYSSFIIAGNAVTIVPDNTLTTAIDESQITIGKYTPIVDDPLTTTIDETGVETVEPSDTTEFTSGGPVTFSLHNLPLGSYGISKRLMLDQDALELYASDYIRRGIISGCILGPEIPIIDEEGCYYTCADCENHYQTLHFVINDVPYNGKEAYVQELLSKNCDLLQITDTTSSEYLALYDMLVDRYEREWEMLIRECNEPCDNGINAGIVASSISCENNLDILKSDMLPSGQYGIYNSDIDAEGTVGESTSSSASIPDLISDNKLTVYNDDTSFNKIFSVVTGIDPTKPDWRHPHYFDVNGLLPLGSLNEAYKHYFTESGQIDFVTLTLDEETETFSPAVLGVNDVSNPLVIATDTGSEIIYKTEAQNLANVEDFIDLITTRENWTQSLVKYHPEFHYLDYQYKTCKMTLTTTAFSADIDNVPDTVTLNSDGFDMLLGSKSTFDEAYSAGFFGPSTGPLSETILFDNDPFFQIPHDFEKFNYTITGLADTDAATMQNILLPAEMLQVKRAIMYQALKKDDAPLTTNITEITLGTSPYITPSHPEHGYDDRNDKLVEYVYRVSFCNAPGFDCSFLSSSPSVDDIIASVSTMDPVQRDLFWHNYVSYYLGLKQKIQHVFLNLYAARQGFYNDCIGNNAHQNLSKIHSIISDYPEARTAVLEWIDVPNNTLYSENRGLLKTKAKRFIPYDSSYDSTQSAQDIYEELNGTADAQLYLDGEGCRLVRDLQTFLNNAPSRPFMDQVFQGQTPSTQPVVNFISPQLLEAIGGNYSIPMTISGSVSGDTLTINFTQGGGLTVTPITLTLPTPDIYGIGWSTYGMTWEIHQMHNVTYLNYDTSSELSYFNVVAKIVSSDPASGITDATHGFREIILTGTTKASMTCTTVANGEASGVDGNPVFIDGGDATNCHKKENFENALKEFIINIKEEDEINSNDYLVNHTMIPEYMKLFMGITTGQDVRWSAQLTGGNYVYALYIDTSPQNNACGGDSCRLLLGNCYAGSLDLATGSLENFTIGQPITETGVTGVYGFYNVNITLGTPAGNTTQTVYLSGRHQALDGYTNKGLQFNFACCTPCGEYDFDGDFIMDDGIFGGASCDKCDNRLYTIETCPNSSPPPSGDQDFDTVDDSIDNCPEVANHNQVNFDFDSLGDACDTEPEYGMCFNDSNGVKGNFVSLLKKAMNDIISDNSTLDSNGFSNLISLPMVNALATDTALNLPYCFSQIPESGTSESIRLTGFRYKKSQNFPSILRWHWDSGVANYNTATYYDIVFQNIPEFEESVSTILDIQLLPANNPYTDDKNEIIIKGKYADDSEFEFTMEIKAQRVMEEESIGSINMCRFLRRAVAAPVRTTEQPAPIKENACNCIPQIPIIYSASDMFDLYVNFSNANPDLHLTAYTLEQFFDLNLQFITEGYLSYMSNVTLNIDSVDDPYFLTLAGFGATALNYGFNNYNNVINDFADYVAQMSDPGHVPLIITAAEGEQIEVHSWSHFATYYLHQHDICPPKSMIPIVKIEFEMENSCMVFLLNAAESYNMEAYEAYLNAKKMAFKKAYLEEGLNEVVENFTMSYDDKEYQYTLYYYDQAGNLIQTVAPEGVQRLDLTPTINEGINNARAGDMEDAMLPSHIFKTKYRYNSLNQLVWQSTPDGGETRFAYDGLGRIVASQNDKQRNSSIDDTPSLNLQAYLSTTVNTVMNISKAHDWKFAGGVSLGTVLRGYAEHTIIIDDAHELYTTEQVIFGLSYTNYTDNTRVYYGFYYDSNGQFRLRSGTTNYGPTYTIANGDKLKIERMNGKVNFYQNGILLHQLDDDNPTIPTIVDFAIREGAMIHNIKIVNYGIPSFSYTCYDKLGRIIEAGQCNTDEFIASINDNGKLVDNSNNLIGVSALDDNYPDNISKYQIEVTKTLYDSYGPFNPDDYLSPRPIRNTRNRVTSILTFDTTTNATPLANNETAIFYNYDIHGNVDEMAQRISPEVVNVEGFSSGVVKKVKYEYDLISGNVNKVYYQPNNPDQFIHRYNYDADNRITFVETSRDNVIWEKDASYEYYEHGPLARVVTGDKKVQGTDYAYTLQGWLKTVNSENLSNGNKDMGRDGNLVSKDAYGFSLSYFGNDYEARHLGSNEGYLISNNNPGVTGPNLYNGNIKRMITSVRGLNEEILPTAINIYSYDQLNRIFSMIAFNGVQTGNEFTPAETYHSDYNYDRNGNLKTLVSTAPINSTVATNDMDSFSYKYLPFTNKLTQIEDTVPSANFPDDIDSQDTDNYHYDEIGQLTQDKAAYLDKINWRVDGKVKSIQKDAGSSYINFFYDGLGNRVAKQVTSESHPTVTTHYTRDAQGNVMAVSNVGLDLEHKNDYILKEHHIYGSSRLGLQDYDASKKPNYYYRIVGDKRYELSNHLGNVLNVISDRKIIDREHDVKLLYSDYFDEDEEGWKDYGDASISLTSNAELSVKAKPNNSGCENSFDFETGTVMLQLTVSPAADLPPGTVLTFEVIKVSTSAVLLSSIVPESGVISESFIAPSNGEYRIRVTLYHPSLTTNIVFTIDNFYAYTLPASSTDYVSLYMPDVLGYNDYYPFGSLIPNRHASIDNYRYGFQGQEKDDEIKGEGNSLNYTFRMHDPRVGRFFAVDPLFKSFPWNSPYAFSENRVIDGIELEGGETEWFMMQAKAGMYGQSVQQITNGVDKSIRKTVDGLIFIATNPKEALKGTGNFLLGAVIKGSGAPRTTTEPTLQYIDAKFGTATTQATQAFEQSITKSADKLINGNLEDKTEVVFDIGLAILADKGIGELALLKRINIAKKWKLDADYVDFKAGVFTKTLKDGTELIQFRLKEGSKGNYYAYPGTTPEQIGLRAQDVVQTYKVIVKGDQKVIISKHIENKAPYYDPSGTPVEGGGIQIKSDDLKSDTNSTFKDCDNP